MNYLLTFGKRLWLLILLFFLGLIATGLFTNVIELLPVERVRALLVVMLIQQLVAFALPAIVIAMLSTRYPARLLSLQGAKFNPTITAIAVAVMMVCQPALNALVQLMELLPWPAQLLELERIAEQDTALLMEGSGPLGWALALCVMAVMPAICEELLFRGALVGVLRSRPMSARAAIWIAAVVFSLLHGQAVGFVARVLLGALFGYVMLWSGSLWGAVACHFANNALVVCLEKGGVASESFGLATPVISCVSAALSLAGIYLMYRLYSRSRSSGM